MAELINMDEWLAELAKATATANGLTPGEMADKTGKSASWITKQIKAGIKHGLLERAGRKLIERHDGIMVPVMAYRPVKKKK